MPRKQHTKRVDAVLARMRKGEVLCRGKDPLNGFGYWLEPSCDTVGPVTASRVIERPEVEKGGDALLEGQDQTYRYRPAK